MKLFVFHTPELAPPHLVPDCAIAVDVLRATSTIATALAAGAEAVQVFSSMEQLMHDSEAWPIDRRLRAGERGGAMVEGCDLGNSPLECTPDRVGGKRLFISTTNGTRCLERVQSTPSVLTAAMINRASVVKHLLAKQPETVWIVGSGWEGAYSLEDTVCAGAIAHSLTAQLDVDLAGNDEVVAAIALFSAWKDNLLKLFHQASHGKRLLRLACDTDLEYCAQLDSIDILPMQREVGVLVGDPQLSEVATRS